MPVRFRFDEHQWVRERLSLYLDGRLDPEARARVERHLAACAACARSWETLRWTVQALRAMPRVPAPRPLALRPEDIAPAPRPVGWLRRAAWAMAAVFLLVLGLDLARTLGQATAPLPTALAPMAPAEAPALRAPKAEEATPAPLFGLAVPSETPVASPTPIPPAPAPSPSAPPFRPSPWRLIEALLLLGILGALALDRWGRRPR
jgi:anti-sigma factor RsiW